MLALALAALVAGATAASAKAAAPDPPRTKPRLSLEQRRPEAGPAEGDAAKRPGDDGVAPVLFVVALVAAGAGLAWLTMSTRPAVLAENTNPKGASDMSRIKRRPHAAAQPQSPAEAVDAAGTEEVPLAGRLEPYSASPQIHDLGADSDAPAAPEPGPEATPDQRRPATADIGPRVAEVLQAAETAAGQIVADAEREAEQLRGTAAAELERAQAETQQLRADAEAYATSTRTEADERAENVRREAHEEVEALRAEAEADAQALREDGEHIREQLAREGLERQRQLAESTHALEDQLAGTLGAVRSIAAELDELLARERGAQADDESLVDALSTPRRRQER